MYIHIYLRTLQLLGCIVFDILKAKELMHALVNFAIRIYYQLLQKYFYELWLTFSLVIKPPPVTYQYQIVSALKIQRPQMAVMLARPLLYAMEGH